MARSASGPEASGRAGTLSRVTSARARVWSSETTGAMVTPGSETSTEYSPAGTPSAGTRSVDAGSASATPRITPVSRAWPAGSPGCGCATRTVSAGPTPGWPAPCRLAPGLLANGTASAAVTVAPASPASSSASPAASAAAVATTALPRYGTGATARPASSATTAASR